MVFSLLGGSGGKSEEKFNSTSIQRVYNESVVKMAQFCDTTFGNSIVITITGDNNQISGLWLNQDIDWSVECVADFFNSREYQNELSSDMTDLAATADKGLSLFGGLITIPVPNFATNTTVNTTQVQETTNRLFSEFSQDCTVSGENYFEIDINGNFNTVGDVTVNQMIEGMTNCIYNAENQESVINDLDTTVRGTSDFGTNIWSWILLAVAIGVILIIVIVIIVAIVRAGKGGNKDGDNDNEMEQDSEMVEN